jgi:hypothetical protein
MRGKARGSKRRLRSVDLRRQDRVFATVAHVALYNSCILKIPVCTMSDQDAESVLLLSSRLQTSPHFPSTQHQSTGSYHSRCIHAVTQIPTYHNTHSRIPAPTLNSFPSSPRVQHSEYSTCRLSSPSAQCRLVHSKNDVPTQHLTFSFLLLPNSPHTLSTSSPSPPPHTLIRHGNHHKSSLSPRFLRPPPNLRPQSRSKSHASPPHRFRAFTPLPIIDETGPGIVERDIKHHDAAHPLRLCETCARPRRPCIDIRGCETGTESTVDC